MSTESTKTELQNELIEIDAKIARLQAQLERPKSITAEIVIRNDLRALFRKRNQIISSGLEAWL